MGKEKETDRFFVIDESGNRYLIIEYVDYMYAGTRDNPQQTIEGRKYYRTLDKRVEKGVYLIDDGSFKLSVFDWTICDYRKIIAKRD